MSGVSMRKVSKGKQTAQPVPRLSIGAAVGIDDGDGSAEKVGRVVEIRIRANDVRYAVQFGRGRSATTEVIHECFLELEEPVL